MAENRASTSKNGLQRGRGPVDEGGHAHVPALTQRDDRAEHREPQEQGRGELIGPDQRANERRNGRRCR